LGQPCHGDILASILTHRSVDAALTEPAASRYA
jgi:hypothetical protein